MPLLDHFRPPMSERRAWEGFHAMWTPEITAQLNRGLLPSEYFAECQVHVGSRVEVDIGSFEQDGLTESSDNGGGVAVQTWAPPKTTLVMSTVFPDDVEVRVFQDSGGATLVGAIELISPGNKDRPETRRAFAAKCAAYLQQGIGLVIIDVVTERLANLHDALVQLYEQGSEFDFPGDSDLYAVAYRPSRKKTGDQIEIWPFPLTLGQKLPIVPLALRRGPTLPLDLETSYMETLSRMRLPVIK